MDIPININTSRRKSNRGSSRRSSNKRVESSNKPIRTTVTPRHNHNKNNKNKNSNKIIQFFVSRPILVTCFNAFLFGIVFRGSWDSIDSSSTYYIGHVIALDENASSSSITTTTTRRLGSSLSSEQSATFTIQQQQQEQQQTAPSNGVAAQEEEATASSSSATNNNNNDDDDDNKSIKKISPISCTHQLANRHLDTNDPNRDMPESPYKHVTMMTVPHNFTISLHKETFDPMRWSSIYNQGNYYETGITEQFQTILDVPQKGLVMDIGMNIGWFTIYSRAMGHDVIGFDPNPIMHTRLCESLQHNGWLNDETVQSFAYGLGAEPATLSLTTGKNPGKASFFGDRLAKRFRKEMTVPVVRLDDVAEQQGWLSSETNTKKAKPMYLVKMDVEGYEYFVLEGAKKLLATKQIQNILLEHSNTDLTQIVQMYFGILYKAGYEIKMFSDTFGKPIRSGMVESINKVFDEAARSGSSMESLHDKEEMTFLTRKRTLNMWWVRRGE